MIKIYLTVMLVVLQKFSLEATEVKHCCLYAMLLFLYKIFNPFTNTPF